MHDLWQLCQKALAKLKVECEKSKATEHGSHRKYGRVVSLLQNRDPNLQMFVLHHERQGVIVYRQPSAYGKRDITEGATVDQVRAYLKKYAGVA